MPLPRLRTLAYDPWMSWNFILEGRFPRLTQLLIYKFDELPLELLNQILDRRDHFPVLEDIEAWGTWGAQMREVTEFLDKAERAGLRCVKLNVCGGIAGDRKHQRMWMRVAARLDDEEDDLGAEAVDEIILDHADP